jgi:uncharacterized protein YndB with AHSA1/START domain
MPVSPERLWDALTDPDEVAGWMGGQVEWDLEEGAAITFHGNDGTEREGQVDQVRPGRYLRFRWWTVPEDEPATEVNYLLEPDDEGTRLTVVERRLEPESPPAVNAQVSTGGGWSIWDGRLVGMWAEASVTERGR